MTGFSRATTTRRCACARITAPASRFRRRPVLTGAVGHGGLVECPAQRWKRVGAPSPTSSLAWIADYIPIKLDADRARYLEGLRRAWVGPAAARGEPGQLRIESDRRCRVPGPTAYGAKLPPRLRPWQSEDAPYRTLALRAWTGAKEACQSVTFLAQWTDRLARGKPLGPFFR
jgi:hypothetical protein